MKCNNCIVSQILHMPFRFVWLFRPWYICIVSDDTCTCIYIDIQWPCAILLFSITLFITFMVLYNIIKPYNSFFMIIYIYCMLVREIWKFIHPRVSYSLRATPEGNMILVGEYIFIFPEPACYKCFIIPNETKKTHTCKILLANIF
jgi:hypothetical protein